MSSLVWGWLPDHVTLPKCHHLCEVDYQTMSPYRSVIPCVRLNTRPCHLTRSVIPCVRLNTRPCHLTEVSSLVRGWLPDHVTLPEVSSLVWGWLPDHVTLPEVSSLVSGCFGAPLRSLLYCIVLATHSLAAASLPRLSEMKPKWFVFKTSWYAFGGWYCIESVASQK